MNITAAIVKWSMVRIVPAPVYPCFVFLSHRVIPPWCVSYSVVPFRSPEGGRKYL